MSDYQPMPPPMASPYSTTPMPTDRYNVLAIVGFVLAFFVSLGAVICGHIALGQIARTGEKGHGLALAAVIIGYAGILFGVIITIFYVLIFAAAISAGMASSN